MKLQKLAVAAAVLATAAGGVLAVPAHAGPAHSSSVIGSVAEAPAAPESGRESQERGIAGVAKALHSGFKAASAYKAAAQVAGWASILGRSETPTSVDPRLEATYFDR